MTQSIKSHSSFEDGVTRFITCTDDQTVADASYRQRINIPLDCRDGACGTCKAFCESGEFDGGTYIDDALSADEVDAGLCAAVQHEAADRIWCCRSPAPRRSPRPRPRRTSVTDHGVRPGCRPPPCRSPSRSRTVPSWPSCPGSTSTSRCPAPTRPGPIRSATRRDDKTADLPGEADARRGDVGLPRRARRGRRPARRSPGRNGTFLPARGPSGPALLLAGGTGLAPDPVHAAQDARPTAAGARCT